MNDNEVISSRDGLNKFHLANYDPTDFKFGFITVFIAQQLKDLPRDQPTKKLNWTLVSCVSRVGLITKTLVAT